MAHRVGSENWRVKFDNIGIYDVAEITITRKPFDNIIVKLSGVTSKDGANAMAKLHAKIRKTVVCPLLRVRSDTIKLKLSACTIVGWNVEHMRNGVKMDIEIMVMETEIIR